MTCPADDEPFLDLVAGQAGLAVSRAAEFASWVRHVVDKLIGDDFAIVAPPLLLARRGHPVFDRLLDRLDDTTWSPRGDILDQDNDKIAQALGLAVGLVERHPLLTFVDVLDEAASQMGIAEDDAAVRELWRFANAWLDTFGARPYNITPIGREKHFEDWLVEHLNQITPYDLELVARQWISPDSGSGRRTTHEAPSMTP